MRTIRVKAGEHRVAMPREIRAGVGPRPFVLEPGEELDVPDNRFIRGRIRVRDLLLVDADPTPGNMRAPLARGTGERGARPRQIQATPDGDPPRVLTSADDVVAPSAATDPAPSATTPDKE